MMSSYNFTEGYNFTGTSIINPITNATEYSFTSDLELITIILIVIMLCQLFRTSYLFLSHIGLIKGRL